MHLKPDNQAVAAALRMAQEPRRDGGGSVTTGPLLGATDGRADAINTSVPDGTHIIPADVVSSLGEGNSVAGAAKLSKMFPTSGAAGPKPVKSVAGSAGMPKIPSMPRIPSRMLTGSTPHPMKIPSPMRLHKMPGMPKSTLKDGGKAHVKVRLSDGEFPVMPEHVAAIGEGDPDRGHRALDAWILHVRKQDIEKRKRLPPPVA